MTVQATPPLPDPVSGRVPPYTQVLEYDDATSQWVIKYDVINTPSQSTTGVAPLPGPSQPDPIETPITEFPDPVPVDPNPTPEPTPFPVEPLPYVPPVEGGGGRDDNTPTGPGITRSPFSGTFYDGATGEVLSDFAQKALSFAFDSGISPVGALANLNTANHFASGLSFDVQKSIMDREKDDIMSMNIEDRANVYGKLNRAAQRAGVSTPAAIGSHSGVGLAGFGNINAGMPDNIGTGSEEGRSSTGLRGGAGPFSEQNKAAKAADAARAAASAKAADARDAGRNQDSNFGGSSGPTGPGGGAGPRGGTGRPGDGANTGRSGPTGPGGGAGPRGGTGRPGDGGGRGSGGSGGSGGSSGSGGQGQSPGGPGRGR